MRKKTLVFTATYNESENIEEFLNSTIKLHEVDVLIIDDNSPDGTSKIIEKYQSKYKNLFLIKRSGKLGLDTAHKEGYDFALENNYKNLITLDADLSHDPSQIPSFIKILNNSAFIIGSRYIAGGKNKMKLSRLILSYLGNKLIKLIFNMKCNEYTTSYRGFNFNLLKNFEIKDVKSKGISKIPKIETFRTLKNLILLKIK